MDKTQITLSKREDRCLTLIDRHNDHHGANGGREGQADEVTASCPVAPEEVERDSWEEQDYLYSFGLRERTYGLARTGHVCVHMHVLMRMNIHMHMYCKRVLTHDLRRHINALHSKN